MTQMILTLDDNAMIPELKAALKMLRGIVSVKVKKDTPNAATIKAIKEAENGNTIKCANFEEYLKAVSE